MFRLPFKKTENIKNNDVISSEYGNRWRSSSVCSSKTETAELHQGIDFALPIGTEVYPVRAGSVIRAIEDNSNLGKVVVISHSDGNYSLYAHLNEISGFVKNETTKNKDGTDIKVDVSVTTNVMLGKSGKTGGASTGPHLHFSLGDGTKKRGGRTLLDTISDSRLQENSVFLGIYESWGSIDPRGYLGELDPGVFSTELHARCGGIELNGDKRNNSFYDNEGTKKVRDNIYKDLRGGNDTYILAPKGRDVIEDSDKDGRLILGGIEIKDAKLHNCTVSSETGEINNAMLLLKNGAHDTSRREYIGTRVNDTGTEDVNGLHLRIAVNSSVVKSSSDKNSLTIKNFDFAKGGFGISTPVTTRGVDDLAAPNFLELVSEEIVSHRNSHTYYQNQQIDFLSNGGYVSAWSYRADNQNNFIYNIYAKVYDSNDQEVCTEFKVTDDDDISQYYFSIKGFASSGFAVFWQNCLNGMLYCQNIYGKFYDNDCVVTVDKFLVNHNATLAIYSRSPSVLSFKDDSVLIVWADYYNGRILTKVFSADGSVLKSEEIIGDAYKFSEGHSSDSYTHTTSPLVTGSAGENGKYVIFWNDVLIGSNDYADGWYKIFSKDHRNITDSLLLPASQKGQEVSTSSISSLDADKFVINFLLKDKDEDEDVSKYKSHAQVFTFNGKQVTASFELCEGSFPRTAFYDDRSFVKGDSKGGFISLCGWVEDGWWIYQLDMYDKNYKTVIEDFVIRGFQGSYPMLYRESKQDLVILRSDARSLFKTFYSLFSTCLISGTENSDKIILNQKPAYGREGDDIFVIENKEEKSYIRDFGVGKDKIDLQKIESEQKRRLDVIKQEAKRLRQVNNSKQIDIDAQQLENDALVTIRDKNNQNYSVVLSNYLVADLSPEVFSVANDTSIALNINASGIGIHDLVAVQNYVEDSDQKLSNFRISTNSINDISFIAELDNIEIGVLYISLPNQTYSSEVNGTLYFSGNLSEVNSAVSNLHFRPEANNDASSIITINLNDGENLRNSTITLNGIAVNDPPEVTVISDNYVQYTGENFKHLLGNVSDIDNNLSELTIVDANYSELGGYMWHLNFYIDQDGFYYVNGTVPLIDGDYNYSYDYRACDLSLCSKSQQVNVQFYGINEEGYYYYYGDDPTSSPSETLEEETDSPSYSPSKTTISPTTAWPSSSPSIVTEYPTSSRPSTRPSITSEQPTSVAPTISPVQKTITPSCANTDEFPPSIKPSIEQRDNITLPRNNNGNFFSGRNDMLLLPVISVVAFVGLAICYGCRRKFAGKAKKEQLDTKTVDIEMPDSRENGDKYLDVIQEKSPEIILGAELIENDREQVDRQYQQIATQEEVNDSWQVVVPQADNISSYQESASI